MARYIEGWDRRQNLLLPECVDDYVDENNPVRVIEAFVGQLNLTDLGFDRAVPAETGRPAYHPATLLKLYIYGYLNRIPSSRRLEREAQRNLELIWLLGHLAPDFKTIADFRRDNGNAIQATCRRFVLLCRSMGLFSDTLVAIDGSKFKATVATRTSRPPSCGPASRRSRRALPATWPPWIPLIARRGNLRTRSRCDSARRSRLCTSRCSGCSLWKTRSSTRRTSRSR